MVFRRTLSDICRCSIKEISRRDCQRITGLACWEYHVHTHIIVYSVLTLLFSHSQWLAELVVLFAIQCGHARNRWTLALSLPLPVT